MTDIIKEILKHLPEDKISEAAFEGANIVLYTKSRAYFLNNKNDIKKAVDVIKKRIELRPDPSITTPPEEAEKIIKKMIGKEAGISNIIFDAPRSQVIIEVEKPGLAIGKQGSILKEIKENTLWVPTIKRMPAIKSQIIENIRAVLYENSDYRKKFLNKVGHRIYDGWLRGKKEEWVRLSYLGGGRQVGRSSILLQTPESRVLLDCGIDPARSIGDKSVFPSLEIPEFNINELDAIIVSHSHLDHSGFVPWLFKMGYRGPVYCTLPTRDVMSLLQLDFTKIQRHEGKDPVYTSEDVREMVKHTIPLEFGEVSDVTPDVRITFYNSGHILGSAMVHMHIGNGLHNILYTGDLKYGRTSLLEPASTVFPRLETLMIESTYGGKDNVLPPHTQADQQLAEIIKMTLERNGKVLLPELGSGRAQEVLVIIDKLVKEGTIKKTPVYIDGMVWDITAIHTAYPEFLNSTVRKQIFHKNENPFLSDMFKQVGSNKERKQIIEEKGACVVMATSGMLVGGPSVEYLKSFCENKNNSIVFSCYQGEGSLGEKIVSGKREIPIQDGNKMEVLKINMDVYKIEITNHSDRNQLMNFVGKCKPKPKKVIINHGENSRCLDLASSLHKMYRIETNAPRNLEAIRVI